MTAHDERHLRLAARLAVRGHGRAEPNPLVGCVLVDADGALVAAGHHERYGGPHAEVNALRRAGARARGATAYVTLEPCSHTGKTGPCADALIEAGVARVVYARRDPNATSGGGAERLRAAGIEVVERAVPPAIRVSDPFVHRERTGRPWVVAKWAQTLDGRIAGRDGSSQWISGPASRRMVHRARGRVDAVMTGVGTVVADDPLLTARLGRVRRVARRVVVDPDLRMPLTAQLVRTARDIPLHVVCRDAAAGGPRAAALTDAGVDLWPVGATADALPLAPALERLAREHDAINVLVEGGGTLHGHLFGQGLVNEAWVFVAPLLLGDEDAIPCASGLRPARLADGVALELISRRTRGADTVLRYAVAPAQSP